MTDLAVYNFNTDDYRYYKDSETNLVKIVLYCGYKAFVIFIDHINNFSYDNNIITLNMYNEIYNFTFLDLDMMYDIISKLREKIN